jgi:hypothetical protein
MIEVQYRTPSRVPPPRTPRPVSDVEKGSLITLPAEKPDLDAQSAGIELCWTTDYTLTVHTDGGRSLLGYATKQSPSDPVTLEGSDFYVVDTGQHILLPFGFNGLVLPHPRFFDAIPAGAFSDMPAVVPRSIAYDNWPQPVELLCVRPKPGTEHNFYAGEPFCQIIPIPRGDVALRQMTSVDIDSWQGREAFVSARDKQLGGYEGFLKHLRKLGWAGLEITFPLTDKEAGL